MTSVLNFENFLDSQDKEPGANSENLGTKKVRYEPTDLEEYQPGALVKLKVRNFVTYSLTEFSLSPSLNMIIGPNGSGKSTFVCAVCLGLAGKPEYIGRAKKVEDYIKNGTDQSTIELTLKNSEQLSVFKMISEADPTVEIKRVITRGKRKSEYFINGHSVDEDYVKGFVKALNIQLDNLCQFLSQERVEEFARLKPDTLLVETVRSVEAGLLDVLNELISLQESADQEKVQLEASERKLNGYILQQEKLDQQVQALEEYEEKSKKRDIHEKLLYYANVKEHREKNEHLKLKYKTVQRELKILEKELKPFLIKGKHLKEKELEVENSLKILKDERSQIKNKFDECTSKLREVSQKMNDSKSRIQYFKTRNISIKANIQQYQLDIETFKAKKDTIQLPDPAEIKIIDDKIDKLVEEKASIKDLIADYENNMAGVNYKLKEVQHKISQKVKRLNSTDRIYLLDKFSSNTDRGVFKEMKETIRYVRSLQEAKGKILEPPLISVSALDKTYAAYLASCVDFNTAMSLTMVDKQAYEKFSGTIIQKFRVNIREISDQSMEPPIDRYDLKNYGFDGYLVDFITGDEDVIKMLCQQQKIHMIPVSKNPLSAEALEALKTPGRNGRLPFVKFIEGSSIHNIRQSDYGQHQTYSTTGLINFENQYYRGDIMSGEQKAAIVNEINVLKQEGNSYEVEMETLRGLKSEKQKQYQKLNEDQQSLNSERIKLTKAANYLKSYDDKIDRLKEQIKECHEKLRLDASGNVQKAEETLQLLYEKQRNLIVQLASYVGSLQDCDVKNVSKSLDLFSLKTKIDALGNVCKNMELAKAVKAEEAITLKEEYERNKNTEEFKKWMRNISSFSADEKEKLNEFATQYSDENKFTSIHIESILSRLSSELSMMNNDASAVKLLKETNENIKNLVRVIPLLKEKVAAINKSIHENKNVLEPKLDSITEKISQKFSSLFVNVGSAGEIRLVKPLAFSEWSIEIRVKFRDNAELQQLNPHVQSGGERAVSTVLYMIALQDFTNSPFRVVDEINQGMDQRNERIVHKIMVENACAENTSQYFLITPKLLTGLHYHERMRVHCVFAGSWIPDPIADPKMIHFGETTSYIH